jgi:hypothetical protein
VRLAARARARDMSITFPSVGTKRRYRTNSRAIAAPECEVEHGKNLHAAANGCSCIQSESIADGPVGDDALRHSPEGAQALGDQRAQVGVGAGEVVTQQFVRFGGEGDEIASRVAGIGNADDVAAGDELVHASQ